MNIIGVHHLLITGPLGCEPDARAFYVGLLGLEEITKPKNLRERGGVWFRGGSVDIHIGARETDTPPGHNRHFALQVRDADAMRDKLNKASIRTEDAAEVTGWKRFYAYDPFGNKIEFLEIL